jgi:hypothetical protein
MFESTDSKKPAAAPLRSQVPPNTQPTPPNAFMETAPSRPRLPSKNSSKGKGKGKGTAKSPLHFDADDANPASIGDEEDDDDDDYVINTDHLKVPNGNGNNGNGVDEVLSNGSVTAGKGKGKSAPPSHFVDTAAEDDEAMYA